jgi:hypothetical protein
VFQIYERWKVEGKQREQGKGTRKGNKEREQGKGKEIAESAQ